jgi:hypothetical protein
MAIPRISILQIPLQMRWSMIRINEVMPPTGVRTTLLAQRQSTKTRSIPMNPVNMPQQKMRWKKRILVKGREILGLTDEVLSVSGQVPKETDRASPRVHHPGQAVPIADQCVLLFPMHLRKTRLDGRGIRDPEARIRLCPLCLCHLLQAVVKMKYLWHC